MRIQGSGHGERRRVVRSGCFHLHGGDLAITTTHHRGSLLLPKWTLTIGKTHDWISPGKVPPFLFFFSFSLPLFFFPLTGDPTPRQFYSHTAGRPITPPHPPFWRTSRHEHRAAISRVVTIPRDCARPSDRFRPEIYRFRNCTQLAPCPERGRRAKGGIESGWSIGG